MTCLFFCIDTFVLHKLCTDIFEWEGLKKKDAGGRKSEKQTDGEAEHCIYE